MNTSPLLDPCRLPVLTGSPTAAPRPLHVVIVDEELPYPPTSGKRIRTLNLLLRLAPRHRLTYLCHRNADAEEARRAAEFFHEHGIETVVVERAVPPRTGLRFYARLAANLLSSLPYSVSSHTSRQLRQAITDYAARHRVDLWHCEWTPYAQALRCLPGVRTLVMAHNVESLIWQRYAAVETNPLKRWFIRRQWRKFQRFERRVYSEATTTVAVSSEDADRIKQEFAGRRVVVVDNGVDTSYFRPSREVREVGRILFLGSLDWRPNLDAVEKLLTCIFPAVRLQVPSARLCLVGRNPPESLRQRVSSLPGVELHGSVPDVRPFLRQCGVMAVPLRIGGGSRLKILEALASGLPVVSTRVGAEGLWLKPGHHLEVVDAVDGMAEALVRSIRNPLRAREQAEWGRQRVLERYDWNGLAAQLERIWFDTSGQVAPVNGELATGGVLA
jgi:glycosyltransferase involved in cell wall biosynthesis